MFPVNFHKNKAKYYAACLANDKPIDAPKPGWTVDDMAQLAGACFFVISTHGPILRKLAAEMIGKKYQHPDTKERKEAEGEVVYDDIHAALEFIGQLTMLVWDEKYDEAHEDFVQCLVKQDGQLRRQMASIKGFKNLPPTEFVLKDIPED